jgi:hypothetical protein
LSVSLLVSGVDVDAGVDVDVGVGVGVDVDVGVGVDVEIKVGVGVEVEVEVGVDDAGVFTLVSNTFISNTVQGFNLLTSLMTSL